MGRKFKKFLLIMLGCLAALHTFEWFTLGRDFAKAAKVPKREALPKCLLMGVFWWGPMKKDLIRMPSEDR